PGDGDGSNGTEAVAARGIGDDATATLEAWISGAAAAIPRVTVMTVGVALPNLHHRGANGLGRDIKHAPTHVCDLTNRLGGLALDHHQVSIDVPAPFDWIERSCCLTRRADQLVFGTAGRAHPQRSCLRRVCGA